MLPREGGRLLSDFSPMHSPSRKIPQESPSGTGWKSAAMLVKKACVPSLS